MLVTDGIEKDYNWLHVSSGEVLPPKLITNFTLKHCFQGSVLKSRTLGMGL
jgi:hypothetical protein